MNKPLAALLVFFLSLNNCFASEGTDQANAFASLYTSLCLKNLQNLEELRQKLKPVPSLPQEKATLFLNGKQGDAWPIPDKRGTFVIALPKDKNFCALFARRADTETALRLFTALVSNPPAPLTSKKTLDIQNQTIENGTTQTISYEWSAPGATRKLMFTITIAPSESAQLQVLGSAAIISQ
jgi:hypothetical protein